MAPWSRRAPSAPALAHEHQDVDDSRGFEIDRDSPPCPRMASGEEPGRECCNEAVEPGTPVPMATSVKLLRLRVLSEAQPRSKKGRPAHATTGVARKSCTQFEVCGAMNPCRSTRWPPISSANTGAVSARPNHRRRRMSASSGLAPLSAVTISGSSAMPQMGHEPGPSWRISGCMGQVKIVPAGAAMRRSAARGTSPARRRISRGTWDCRSSRSRRRAHGCAWLSSGSTNIPHTGSSTRPVSAATRAFSLRRYTAGLASNFSRHLAEQKWIVAPSCTRLCLAVAGRRACPQDGIARQMRLFIRDRVRVGMASVRMAVVALAAAGHEVLRCARKYPGGVMLDTYTRGGIGQGMKHHDKSAHLKRLSKIEGQVRGLSRMVEEDRYCIDIVTQVSAVRRPATRRGRHPAGAHRALRRTCDRERRRG